MRFFAGEHINNAAAKLVAEAIERGEAVTATFNDITIYADEKTTAADVVAQWTRESAARAEAYRSSPEGIAAEQERAQRRQHLQETHDHLMRKLPSLDFRSPVAVLDWLCAMQEPSDGAGVTVNKHRIITTFAAHGFEPGANCDDAYNGDDADNSYRWLVGQALSTLNKVAIHGTIHKFATEWKAKFIRQSEMAT